MAIIPVSVAVGQYELVDAPFGQPVGQPTLVSGVRDLHPVETLQRGMGYDDPLEGLAQRQHRVVFAAKSPNVIQTFLMTLQNYLGFRF